MTPVDGAPRAVAIAAALGCWVVTIALLLAIPALVIAEGTDMAALTPLGSGLWWATAAVLTLQSGALLGTRAAPRTVLLVLTALTLGLGALAPGAAYTLSHLPVVVAVFLAVPRRTWPQLRGVLALTALAVSLGIVLNGLRSGISTWPGVLGEALVQGAGVVGLPALIALALASLHATREAQRKELAALTREREALEREREALGRAAASEERAAMARELHDIAAHHLSGIALVAAAADRQIDTDPEAAHVSVRQVRSQTRAVLEDIRRVVGLLRGGERAERSVENLATIPALIRSRAEAGLPVRLEPHAPADGREPGEGLGPLAQLVAYRMVQESLTNAAEHAPSAECLVTVDDTAREQLVITVRNEGPTADRAPRRTDSGGFGLIGMRERTTLIGGHLEHGPTADGGWRVQLSIPRDLTGARAGAGVRAGAGAGAGAIDAAGEAAAAAQEDLR